MPALIIYLIKANVALTLFYLAYRFGLRRLTFYTLNRYFLLIGIAFSATFPLVDVAAFFQQHEQLAGSVTYYAVDWNSLQQYMTQQDPFTIWNLLQYIFWTGVVVMAIRFIIQLISLLRIHLQATSGKINNEKIKLIPGKINPFSFFKNIYINPSLHSPEELKTILAHEKIHIREWHTLDVLAGEINNIFYWFNPGAWLMKNAIRENLEFITDRKLLRSGINAKSYQYSLLKTVGAFHNTPLANNFNFSHLKQRIRMMNKKRSARFHLLRYLLLLSVVAIFALVITSSRGQKIKQKLTTQDTLKIDTLKVMKVLPNVPFNGKGYFIKVMRSSGKTTVLSRNGVMFGPFNLYNLSKGQLTAFNKRFGSSITFGEIQEVKKYVAYLKEHPKISNYSYRSSHTILIWTGNKSKVYDINRSYDKNLLLKRFGDIPPKYGHFSTGIGAPDAPKPKYTPPRIKKDTVKPDKEENNFSKEYQKFLKRNSSVKRLGWTFTKNNKAQAIWVTPKKGPIEIYQLNNQKEMETAKIKYGPFPDISSIPQIKYTPPKVVEDTALPKSKMDDYYANIAYKAAKEKNYNEAKAFVQKSLKLNPDNSTAKQVLNYVKQVEDYQEKLKEYKQKEKLNPLDTAKVKVHYIPPKVIKDTPVSERLHPVTVAGFPNVEREKSKVHYVPSKVQTDTISNGNKSYSVTTFSKVYTIPTAMFVDTIPDNHATTFNSELDNALLIVDNKIRNVNDKMTNSIYLKKHLNPEDINAISILKGKPAIKSYGQKGKNGVIEIYTKDFMKKHPAQFKKDSIPSGKILHPDPSSITAESKAGIVIGHHLKNDPIYVIDNKIEDSNYLKQQLSPSDIQSIFVLKDRKAIEKYGVNAKDGVIEIYTKDFAKKHPEQFQKDTVLQPKKNFYDK